jgi:signal transduction histidine kinase
LESTAQLKAELKKAQDQIAELHREKKSFLKIVSHDLRSPISRIIGFADLLKRDLADDEDLRPFAENIEAAGWNLSKTIARIVEVEHFLSEDRELIFQTLDLQASAESLMYDLQGKYPTAKIIVEGADLPVEAKVDKPYFDHIFNNLVSNACKFGDPDQDVKVSFQVNPDTISMTVSNFGNEIPEEEEKLLFKKFAKISTRPNNEEANVGLGLFVVKTCVDALGGAISYSREPEGATSFKVIFSVENN